MQDEKARSGTTSQHSALNPVVERLINYSLKNNFLICPPNYDNYDNAAA
jgi:hypothetical protein